MMHLSRRLRVLLTCALLLLALSLGGYSAPRLQGQASPAQCASLPVQPGWQFLHCPGTLHLRRLTACPSGPPPLANGTSPPLLRLAFAQGPDELLVVLEGPEFHALQGVHSGGCAYAFPLPHPVLGGLYRVAAVLHRQGWAALAESPEASAAFPPLVGLHLASCLLRLGRASAGEQELEAARLAALGQLPAAAAASPPLPRCSTAGALFGPGRWLRTRTAVGMFGGEDGSAGRPLLGWYAPPDRLPYTSGLLLYTEVERDLAWAPYACAPPAPEQQAGGQSLPPTTTLPSLARRCLSGARLRLQGDSQLRTLYNDILQRHCSIYAAAAKGLVHDVCVGAASGRREALQGLQPENGTCPGLASCYLADPWGLQPFNGTGSSTGSSSSSGGWVVVGLGQHSAARHEPLAAFAQRMAGYLAAAAAGAAAAQARLLLLLPQPFPVRYGDSGVLLYADGRTQPRLALYTEVARAAAEAVGVQVVPVWDMAAPLVDACPDGAHFNGVYSALDALGGRLLAAICPDLPV